MYYISTTTIAILPYNGVNCNKLPELYITILYNNRDINSAPGCQWEKPRYITNHPVQTHTYMNASIHTGACSVCFHYTLVFPSPVLFSTVIGKPVKAFWETWPPSQGKASRQKILKCISFTIFYLFFFVMHSSELGGGTPQTEVEGAAIFSHSPPVPSHVCPGRLSHGHAKV